MAEQLTLEMIQKSPRLRELAALPGDEVDNGKLIRNFSEEGDRMDLGKQITQDEIDSSPKLQILKASPGDRKNSGAHLDRCTRPGGRSEIRCRNSKENEVGQK